MKNEMLLNQFSVKSLFNYPESKVSKKILSLLVYSVEKKDGNKKLLELADLKYKAKDIIINTERDIKKGDYILIKNLEYKYGENVSIEIKEFEIMETQSQAFIEELVEYKNDQFTDCYFIYHKKDKKFIGFNEENLEFNFANLQYKKEFKDSDVYYFRRLKKNNDLFLTYNNIISYVSEKDGESLPIKLEKLSKFIPYCFKGKVLLKENNKIFLAVPNIDKIFTLTDSKEKTKNIEENQYISINSAKFNSKDEKTNIINFEINNFTKIKILNNIIVNEIEKKIYFRFNYSMKDQIRKVIKISIELNERKKIEFQVNESCLYYIYECDNELEYFPQKINLFYDINFSRSFEFFVYKGFLNEVNIDVSIIGVCSYEFLFYSREPKYLPSSIEIKSEDKVEKYSNFQTFGNKTRKKITLVNIKTQCTEEIGNGNNFFKIFLCNKNGQNLYGTFKLNSIEFKEKKEYNFNETLYEFLKNIFSEFEELFFNNKTGLSHDYLAKKYIYNTENHISLAIEKELEIPFNLCKIRNEKYTLDYFNSIVLWNILNYIIHNNGGYICIQKYIKIYKQIENKKISYVDKSMLLVGIYLRIRENKNAIICPKIYFYEDLDDKNAYKMAYNFQFSIIDNITEFSALFQPFLQLDSYFMDMIYYKGLKIDKKKFENGVVSAYTISMLPLNIVKKHLVNTIKPYFFILKKACGNERNYNASVQKDNQVITYNENILLYNSNYQNMKDCEQLNIKKDYAFILTFENLHENFSHNKEGILNVKNSPTLYFDDNFNYSYVYESSKEINNKGEAGQLLESFICEENLLEEMKNIKYKMGNFLDIKYFIDKDFKILIKSFIKIREDIITNEIKYKLDDNSLKYSLKTDDNKYTNEKNNEDDKNNKKDIEQINNIKKDKGDEEEKIFLSRYNTVIIKGKTLEELSKKISDMKNKKFVQREIIVPKNDDKNFY